VPIRILPLDHPVHVAEDAATLDVLSGGRLDFGVTRASLDENCHRVFQSPLEESRGRFEEALEVIVRAWTEERFSYEGIYYRIPELSVFPKPLQTPHPPIAVVAVSPESLDYAARKGYSAFIGAVRPIPELRETFGKYRDALRERQPQDGRASLNVNRFIYVSDSDATARREIEGPFMAFIKERAPDLKATLAKRYGDEKGFSFDRFLHDFCLFGSPATVAARIEELREQTGLQNLLATLNYITLDHALCLRSMELFAKEVMPAFAASGPSRASAAAHGAEEPVG